MGNTNINFVQMSDAAIVAQLGAFVKHKRVEQQKTQAALAEMAGLNRWTIGQIENGESITLMSLIQVLRALDCLYVLETFQFTEEISPLEYAKMKRKQQKKRVRKTSGDTPDKDDLGW